MRAQPHPIATDQAIARIATRQGGVVSRQQLLGLGLGLGLSSAGIGRRLAAGRLLPVPGHRGVFMVGHAARTPRTMYWAAHLCIGPFSVISHRSAAALWELRASAARVVELTVAGPTRRRSALRVHRTRWLPDRDVVEIDGLRVTSVARTLLDLGSVVSARQVERAFDQADVAGVLDIAEIGRVLHEGRSRPGARTLQAVAARDAAGSTLTESRLEELLLAIVRRARLPEPVCQYRVLEYRADFCWPAVRLVVEADGPSHDTPTGRLHDARRDVRLQNAGWRVLRFPWREIVGDPGYIADAIARALGR